MAMVAFDASIVEITNKATGEPVPTANRKEWQRMIEINIDELTKSQRGGTIGDAEPIPHGTHLVTVKQAKEYDEAIWVVLCDEAGREHKQTLKTTNRFILPFLSVMGYAAQVRQGGKFAPNVDEFKGRRAVVTFGPWRRDPNRTGIDKWAEPTPPNAPLGFPTAKEVAAVTNSDIPF